LILFIFDINNIKYNNIIITKLIMDSLQIGLDKKIKQLCNNIQPNVELEASFGSYKKPITLKKFHSLLKYIKVKSNNNKLVSETLTSLDILYNYDQKTNSTYRLSILNNNNINNFIRDNSLFKNNTIFSKLTRQFINQEKSNNTLILINKIKSADKFIALDEFDIRIKISEENSDIDQSVIKKLLSLDESEKYQILYRYKQRVSMVIHDDPTYTLRIDLTDVKTTKNITNINNSASVYELEVDISFKKAIKDDILSKILDSFGKTIINLEQFLQESSTLITKTESTNIIKSLNKLAYDDDNDTYKDLPAMQSASVEIQHVIDYIPGNYAVSDKADGERYFLMIQDNNVYIISNNLEVKKIKSNIGKKSQYNLTVLDGEYIYIPKYKKFLFLTFDILFFQGKDLRIEELLKNRLLLATKVLNDVFNVEMIIGIYKDSNFVIDEIYNFNKSNIENHLSQLNDKLLTSSDNHVINYKYFMFPVIGFDNIIYKLSTLMYDIYTTGSENKCPYILDGMIYTPINQKYTRVARDIKNKILKWKPPEHNSIDFFVKFERNPETNKILTVYDRTSEKGLEDYINSKSTSTDVDFKEMTDYTVKSNVYQILNLYVGKVKNNQEVPYPFQKENDLNIAYIYLVNGYPVDINGNIIEDSTVVEFSYNDKLDIEDKFRWIPLRTRFDKTESVMRFKRKYGNNSEIANKVWNSIKNPITYNDIKLLGDNNTSANQLKNLKSKITSETITSIRRDDSYYQLVTNLGKSLRDFHNWIKSNMIYTYCSKKILLDKSIVNMDILDIGSGRGGDLMKFYHARAKSVVATDVNESSLFSGSDGAVSRYNVMKKKMPNFPKMFFIVADAGQQLDYTNQATMGKMNDENIKLLKQVFGNDDKTDKFSTFDVINAQFMIHYLLKNTNTWTNFCSNVNKYLRPDGYLLITTLDGTAIDKEFINNHITKTYISPEGENKILFDIIKKYESIDDSDIGVQIDVHLPMFMDEGVYQSEYLVKPSFLINELKTKCNLRLVETESFQNLYYVYEDFFNNTAHFESKPETRKFFNDVKKFYNQNDEITKDWFEYSKLNRYFIFQKI